MMAPVHYLEYALSKAQIEHPPSVTKEKENGS
jgi:hypothetical protein